jgi:hypothetical protein
MRRLAHVVFLGTRRTGASVVVNPAVTASYTLRATNTSGTSVMAVQWVPVAASGPGLRDYTGHWWGGTTENGWGMTNNQHGQSVFGVIYFYDATGEPTWAVMPGGTWNSDFTAFTADLYSPTGSPYTSYDASQLVAGTPSGSITLTFATAGLMTASYRLGYSQWDASGPPVTTNGQKNAHAADPERGDQSLGARDPGHVVGRGVPEWLGHQHQPAQLRGVRRVVHLRARSPADVVHHQQLELERQHALGLALSRDRKPVAGGRLPAERGADEQCRDGGRSASATAPTASSATSPAWRTATSRSPARVLRFQLRSVRDGWSTPAEPRPRSRRRRLRTPSFRPSQPETASSATPTIESMNGVPAGLAFSCRNQALQMKSSTTTRLIDMWMRPIFLV